jgi:pimeloyl-ACP methyl ester carboxylesterase
LTRLLTTLAVFAMVAGSCSSKDSPPTLTWTDCGAGLQCGTVTVPLDYSNARGDTIKIALIRKRATDQSRRVGSLLMNPGGPGQSGIQFLRNVIPSFARLNARFDLVSFDPRGVGQSTPVHCLSAAQLDAAGALDTVLDDPLERQTYIDEAKAFAQACRQKNARILPFVDTRS